MEKSIVPAIQELEKAYSIFNDELFNGECDDNVKVVIQTKGRKKYIIGFHAPKRWYDENTDTYSAEISISAEDLAKHDPFHVLLHEMVHHWNFQNDINDASSNGYHNKKFKVVAERVGLEVERSKKYGWSKDSLTDRVKEIIERHYFNYELFKEFRIQGPPQKTYLRKFTCSCNFIVRVARHKDFSATCNLCGTNFVLAD